MIDEKLNDSPSQEKAPASFGERFTGKIKEWAGRFNKFLPDPGTQPEKFVALSAGAKSA